MPNYKGHLFGGAVAFSLVVFFCSLHLAPCATLVEWLLCVLAGSLFPDIDTKSKGQKIFYIFLCAAMLICLLNNKLKVLAYVALAGMLPLLTRHRGIFHHFWFIVALVIGSALLLTQSYPYAQRRIWCDAAFFIMGVFSHLYLDVGMRRTLRLK